MAFAGISLSRLSALPALAALAVAGCGTGGSGPAPTLGETPPLLQQDGTLVPEFAAICARIVIGGEDPSSVVSEYGWTVPDGDGAVQLAAMKGFVAEKSQGALSIEIMPLGFPHLEGETCMVTVLDEQMAGMVDASALDDLDGFIGSTETFSADSASLDLGRYSAVARDGAVVTINTTKAQDGRYAHLSMTKTKPVQPAN